MKDCLWLNETFHWRVWHYTQLLMWQCLRFIIKVVTTSLTSQVRSDITSAFRCTAPRGWDFPLVLWYKAERAGQAHGRTFKSQLRWPASRCHSRRRGLRLGVQEDIDFVDDVDEGAWWQGEGALVSINPKANYFQGTPMFLLLIFERALDCFPE